MTELSIEEKFAVQKMKLKVEEMSREELLEELVETYRRMIVNEAVYLPQIQRAWGLTDGKK